jgi:hypothetical protein
MLLWVAGCAAQTLPPPQASLASLENLRASNLPAMRVGEFGPAPGLHQSTDSSVVFRSVNLTSPYGGSFAKYLGKTIEADLASAGKLDPHSDLVISGFLTQSQADTGLSKGAATLGAHFTLTRAGKTVFDKQLSIDAAWDSSFVGVVAIPDAMNNYTALYDKLAIKLFSDQDFIAAAQMK